jgi:hypothetical protein
MDTGIGFQDLAVVGMREWPGRAPLLKTKLHEHVCGLFPRAMWLRLIGETGFEVRPAPLVHDERPVGAEGFLAIRPGLIPLI